MKTILSAVLFALLASSALAEESTAPTNTENSATESTAPVDMNTILADLVDGMNQQYADAASNK